MDDKAFHMLNDAVLEFVVKHRDVDPMVATMQYTLTELSRQAANSTLDISKRILAVDIADKILYMLLSYISQEYPKEFRTFPPVAGFTRR